MGTKELYDSHEEDYKCQVCGILTGGKMIVGIGRGVDKFWLAREIGDMRATARCSVHEYAYDEVDNCYGDGGRKGPAFANRGSKTAYSKRRLRRA